MPVQSEIRKLGSQTRAATPGGESSGSLSFARRRRAAWVAYKGRPAAKPASPPAEKAPPPKEAQPQAPAAPKPSEPAKEGGAGKGSRK
jgi:hypothetical protein